jgi:hypothetical protein
LHKIQLRPLTKSDYDIVLAWWGIPEVRAFTTLSHQPNFASLVAGLSASNRQDFMVWLDGRRIGRTCLIDHGAFEEISAYICELDLLKQGLGSLAIEATIGEATKPLRCRIKNDNVASISTFLKQGFLFYSDDAENVGYAWYYLSDTYERSYKPA